MELADYLGPLNIGVCACMCARTYANGLRQRCAISTNFRIFHRKNQKHHKSIDHAEISKYAKFHNNRSKGKEILDPKLPIFTKKCKPGGKRLPLGYLNTCYAFTNILAVASEFIPQVNCNWVDQNFYESGSGSKPLIVS